MLCGSRIKIWNFANHMKKRNKEHQTLSFQFFTNRFSILMFFVFFFHVVCKISNSNKHLAQASCTELTLGSCCRQRLHCSPFMCIKNIQVPSEKCRKVAHLDSNFLTLVLKIRGIEFWVGIFKYVHTTFLHAIKLWKVNSMYS